MKKKKIKLLKVFFSTFCWQNNLNIVASARTKKLHNMSFMKKVEFYFGSKYTLPTAEILSGKNARAWVSMVSYLKK